MFNSYSFNTSGGICDYAHSTVEGDVINPGISVHRNVLYNGEWTVVNSSANNNEPQEALSRTCDVPNKREDPLEELGALKANYNEKDKEIVYLKNKLYELETYGQRKESDFEQKMEETLQQLTKLKKAAFLANGNFMKKNSQFEELKKELQTTKEQQSELERQNSCLKDEIKILQEKLAKMDENNLKQVNCKEHDPRFNAMTASIKEEVKILRAGLGKIREEIIEGSVNISQQAVQLQNLLSASKTGLTSFKGRTDGHTISSNASKPCENKTEDITVNVCRESSDRIKQHQKGGITELNESLSEEQNKNIKTKYPLFRAEDYFDPQPSEFDFLANIVIETGPVHTATTLVPANRNEFHQKETIKAKARVNSRPLPTTDVTTNVKLMTPRHYDGAGISTAKIWNPYSNPVRAGGYLQSRPLPANSAVRAYHIPEATKAVRCLNNRPLPTGNNAVGTYQAPLSMKEEQGGFFGRTFNNWFGF